MKKIICMFLTLLLLVCIVGCSQAKDSDNHVVQDYSEEYEVSPYGSEEALDTLGDLKISMSTEKDLDLKHLSFLIENIFSSGTICHSGGAFSHIIRLV